MSKKPPLTRSTHIGIETENEEIEIDRIFLSVKVFLFGVQIVHIQLHSKITLNSASKLNTIRHDTNAS